MAAPAAVGLFHRAISMSGGDHVATPTQADAVRGHFLAALRAEGFGADGLLSAPTGALLAAQLRLGSGARDTWIWRPMIDGRTLSDTPTRAFADGRAARVPLIAGTTQREGAYYQARDETFAARADAVLVDVFGDEASRVLEAYRARATSLFDAEGDIDARVQIGTDERYGFPTRRLLDAHSRYAPVWRYRFDATTPGLSARLRAGHGADVPYVLGEFAADPDAAALARARQMRDFLANFIRSGSPAHALGLSWAAYDKGYRSTLLIDERATIAADPDGDLLGQWEDREWVPGEWWELPAGASPRTR
jgi:para-nitrobenzyl esterase